MKKSLGSIVGICIIACSIGLTACQSKTKDAVKQKEDNTFDIVASFYPMHILAMNLASDIDNVNEKSMSDPNMGCIHDHTFTTEDLKKIENADAYIENGLGLEVFNDQIKEAYPDTAIIEASADIDSTSEEINPHVWTNIDNYINQVEYVSKQLQLLDKDNKEAYSANEKEYVEKLQNLKDTFKDELKNIEGKKVLVLDETLPSFCEYAKLEQYEIKTDHEQEAISAEQIKETIEQMKEEGVSSIIVAKGTDKKNAETIAKETGATIYELNSCMVGDVDEEAYINDMKENFEIIVNIN